ncbi:hypothetical protein [Streptomyces sp. NPDC097619]|uniref:hypothetical protein n=1 Tax=Streptomyces sp. NPDC097619 TaxID=3157228 RepID=UPI00332ADEBB
MPISMTTAGGLLLCRAEPRSVRPFAQLLRERLLLAPAGPEWSVLTPQGKPWRATDAGAGGPRSVRPAVLRPLRPEDPHGTEGAHGVQEVLEGWSTAVAVGAGFPVLGLWWDEGRTGFALASGLRRTLAYGWEADGTPAGEAGTLRLFAARLGLDPVLDMEVLDGLAAPDAAADGRSRLLGLIALLSRAGLLMPAGLSPGEPADRLREAAQVAPGSETVEWSGWRDAVRAELEAADREGRLRGGRVTGAVELAVGLPLLAWGLHRRHAVASAAGAAMAAHGATGLSGRRPT